MFGVAAASMRDEEALNGYYLHINLKITFTTYEKRWGFQADTTRRMPIKIKY